MSLQYRINEYVFYFETGNVETRKIGLSTKGEGVAWLKDMKTRMNHCRIVEHTNSRLVMQTSIRRYTWNIEEYTETEEELRQSIQIARETIEDLVLYLQSSKFNEDPTVQVADVLRRIAPVRSELASELWK